MPIPRFMRRFNKAVTNRVSGPIAPFAPLMGVVIHCGATSHRQYRTPVNVFRRGDRFVFALTYGPDAQWVQNVLAEGGCRLETRGRTWQLGSPRIFHDTTRRLVPLPLRLILHAARVSDFLDLVTIARPDLPA